MFVHISDKIVNENDIKRIDFGHYLSRGEITVHLNNNVNFLVKGSEATIIIMSLCPSALEGKEFRYAKHAWAIHNLIGHPLMQIFSWFHLTKLGIKIHDATVPDPKEE